MIQDGARFSSPEPSSFRIWHPLFLTLSTRWRHYLQDINFWLNGYLNCPAYHFFEERHGKYRVQWNVGVRPAACFTRALSSIIRDIIIRKFGPFDHVIEVDMKQAATVMGVRRFDIYDVLHIKVAEQLGLLEHKYDMVDAELRYYTYDMEKKQDDTVSPLELKYSIAPQIAQHLWNKKYLLVVQNLDRPIKPIEIYDMTEGLWLPAPLWKNSSWIISTTSQDVYDRSKPKYDCVIKSFAGDDILILTLHSLKQEAKYISVAVGHGEDKYWHQVALQCFHYAMLHIPHYSTVVDTPECDAQANASSSDELIRHWAAQCLLTVMKPSVQETMGEDTDGYHCKYYGDDIYQLGNVILEAFWEYSLLHLPFSPATKGDEATISAAHFLAYHSLVVEPLTSDELCEGNHSQLLEHMQWISYVGDQ